MHSSYWKLLVFLTSSKTKVDIRPKTSHGRSEPRLSSTVRHNSAVDRFAELEKQILSRHTIEKVNELL